MFGPGAASVFWFKIGCTIYLNLVWNLLRLQKPPSFEIFIRPALVLRHSSDQSNKGPSQTIPAFKTKNNIHYSGQKGDDITLWYFCNLLKYGIHPGLTTAYSPPISLHTSTSRGIIPQLFAFQKDNFEIQLAGWVDSVFCVFVRVHYQGNGTRVSGGVEYPLRNKYQTWLCNIVALLNCYVILAIASSLDKKNINIIVNVLPCHTLLKGHYECRPIFTNVWEQS